MNRAHTNVHFSLNFRSAKCTPSERQRLILFRSINITLFRLDRTGCFICISLLGLRTARSDYTVTQYDHDQMTLLRNKQYAQANSPFFSLDFHTMSDHRDHEMHCIASCSAPGPPPRPSSFRRLKVILAKEISKLWRRRKVIE